MTSPDRIIIFLRNLVERFLVFNRRGGFSQVIIVDLGENHLLTFTMPWGSWLLTLFAPWGSHLLFISTIITQVNSILLPSLFPQPIKNFVSLVLANAAIKVVCLTFGIFGLFFGFEKVHSCPIFEFSRIVLFRFNWNVFECIFSFRCSWLFQQNLILDFPC